MAVTEQQIEQIAGLLIGLKPAEWSRIHTAVDKMFSEMYCKLELSDIERLTKLLKGEQFL